MVSCDINSEPRPGIIPTPYGKKTKPVMGSPNTEANDKVADSAATGDLSVRLYNQGERVLAFHGPNMYDAKARISSPLFGIFCFDLCFRVSDFERAYEVIEENARGTCCVVHSILSLGVLKVELQGNEWKYFVHYLGWNKNWDEWVVATRLVKRTEENIRKQRIQRYVPEDAKADKEDPKNNVAKGKKRKIDFVVEKDRVSTDKLVKIRIPSILRKQLVDDCEFVTKQDKLVRLPRCPNVDEILKQYLEYRSDNKDDLPDYSVAEVLNGLRRYFDKALHILLLYKQERRQFQEAVGSTVSPSTIYGAEHLLRLFVKLPDILSSLNMEEETITMLQLKLTEFLKFMEMNHSSFFLSSYDESKAAEGSGKGKDV
ncbi:MRG1-like protein [Drosera capensis]